MEDGEDKLWRAWSAFYSLLSILEPKGCGEKEHWHMGKSSVVDKYMGSDVKIGSYPSFATHWQVTLGKWLLCASVSSGVTQG